VSGAAGGGAPAFPSPWRVKPGANVEAFSVGVPELRWLAKLARMGVNQNQVVAPGYLRLDMRRKGFRGKLTRRPVLQVQMNAGANNDELIVSDALAACCPPQGTQIEVTGATKRDFNRFRLSRSKALLIGAAAVPVGGTLIGVGAAPAVVASSVVAAGLVIGGAVVACAGTVGAAWAAWRAGR
jgi:hypothetical protein